MVEAVKITTVMQYIKYLIEMELNCPKASNTTLNDCLCQKLKLIKNYLINILPISFMRGLIFFFNK
jgi:hypothetical protein